MFMDNTYFLECKRWTEDSLPESTEGNNPGSLPGIWDSVRHPKKGTYLERKKSHTHGCTSVTTINCTPPTDKSKSLIPFFLSLRS